MHSGYGCPGTSISNFEARCNLRRRATPPATDSQLSIAPVLNVLSSRSCPGIVVGSCECCETNVLEGQLCGERAEG